MKKQVAVVCLSFTSLFVLNAITPDSLWLAGKDEFKLSSRSPANDEVKEFKIEKKDYSYLYKKPKTKVPFRLPEEKATTVVTPDPLIACIQEKNNNLEEEVTKLVADKEKILEELKALRESGQIRLTSAEVKQEEKPEDKKEDKKEEVAKAEKSDDKKIAKKEDDKKKPVPQVASSQTSEMMQQLANLMISQQQQQEMMLNQLFSMMGQQSQLNLPIAPDMSLPQNNLNAYLRVQGAQLAFQGFNASSIGVSQDQMFNPYTGEAVFVMSSPYSLQVPVQARAFPQPQQVQQVLPAQVQQSQPQQQPMQYQQPLQHGGFDFNQDVSMMMGQNPFVRTNIN